MYCPGCGTENGETASFCRACGADLRLTSRAVARSIGWREFLATKLDERLSSRYAQSARDAGPNIFIGILSVMLGVWYLLTGEGGFFFWLLVTLGAIFGIGVGVYDGIIYRRSTRGFPRDEDRLPGDLSIYKSAPPRPPRELTAARTTNEIAPPLPAPHAPREHAAPASVTESTTRHLEQDEREGGG
jgi:zinc-ribbon domain